MNPVIRQVIYGVATIGTAVVGVLLTLNVIDGGTAGQINDLLGAISSWAGTAASVVAAVHLAGQQKSGILNPAPADPVTQVLNGVQAVQEAQTAAKADLDKVNAAVASVSLAPVTAQTVTDVKSVEEAIAAKAVAPAAPQKTLAPVTLIEQVLAAEKAAQKK